MEELLKYTVTVRKSGKNLYFNEITVESGGQTSTQVLQSLGIGEGMNKASEIAYHFAENAGMVK